MGLGLGSFAAARARARTALSRSNIWRVLPEWFGGIASIFVFHRVRRAQQSVVDQGFYQGEADIERLLDHLQWRGREIVSLDTLVERLAEPRRVRPMALITFDDGYRDNLVLGGPIFARRRVPWTVYVVTGFPDRTLSYWWGALERVIARERTVEIDLPGLGGRLTTRTAEEKTRAFEMIARAARGHGALLARSLADRYGMQSADALAEDAMSWAEVRELAADPRVTIGAHSGSHRPMSALSEEEARIEMTGSRARIETMTGIRPRHFALPFGAPDTWLPAHSRMAEQAGFASMVTTVPANVPADRAVDSFALPRFTISGAVEAAQIDAHLSGLTGLLTLRAAHPGLRPPWGEARRGGHCRVCRELPS